MMPAVPVPRSAGIRVPVEVKLKPRYRYDPAKGVFESDSGARFRRPAIFRRMPASSTRCRSGRGRPGQAVEVERSCGGTCR